MNIIMLCINTVPMVTVCCTCRYESGCRLHEIIILSLSTFTALVYGLISLGFAALAGSLNESILPVSYIHWLFEKLKSKRR